MEKININNYESFFLDFLEGNLEDAEVVELNKFLDRHPNLAQELDINMNDLALVADEAIYDAKNELKVNDDHLLITAGTVDDIMVTSIEKQLSANQQKHLIAYIEKHNLHKLYANYQSTILVADQTIVHPNKKVLKQNDPPVIPLFTKIVAAAAVVMILISFGLSGNSPNRKYASRSLPLYEDIMNVEEEIIVSPNDLVATQVEVNENIESNSVNNSTDSDLIASSAGIVNILNSEDSKDLRGSKTTKAIKRRNIDKVQFSPKKLKSIKRTDNNEMPVLIAMSTPEKLNEQDRIATEESKNDMAVLLQSEQPFKLITNAAGNAINRPVVFERDKIKNSTSYVAYRFKLGSFEFERKKSK